MRALCLVAVALAGCASPAAADGPGYAKVVSPPVSHEKFVKSVRIARREKARADRLARVLRHRPDVQEAIDLAAFTYGVDPGRMSRIAFCESRYDPSAQNRTSSAAGLFQFLGSTWASNRYGSAGFSVWSPMASALGAAYHMSRYGDRAWECRP